MQVFTLPISLEICNRKLLLKEHMGETLITILEFSERKGSHVRQTFCIDKFLNTFADNDKGFRQNGVGD